MRHMDITQAEADALRHMEKHRVTEENHLFPTPYSGASLSLPLQSPDRREHFFLDITRGRISLHKVTYQNRARQVLVLVRLDIAGPPHRNPDGQEIQCPHLHLYREGYGDKWAVPLGEEPFTNPESLYVTLQQFMRFCNITRPPHFEQGLFE
jgi:hypothetical protein